MRIDYDSQRLLCGIHPLNDLDTLEEADVQSESTLVQCIELLGGAKKRKKKNFAKPKKGKHKKKKVKLAVLKLYKVDGNDQITRLRKECPMSSCGPGVFMALHRNRSYCGRCGGTFVSSTPAS
ncbi:ribosomal-ubiquitin protein RPS27A [Cardiosporidium cionae]|uniref:Ribosomal-ubiquitin protein RPS27A n=1 Tax=Cardiosporidium cionae TaxID=476202 RepID=A0ABQ7JE63_9APIC|nr:ribosomal-ubiquitin protein RPS27A [Cardiosporidium cionae]|eukprot:KAF8822308.1 ribosomal-ubiquitin protein RPS27A [Cardiosporidium cionae]